MSATHKKETGFTLIELVVTLSIASILAGYGIVNLVELTRPAASAAGEMAAFFKAARAKAISTTSAYSVLPNGATGLQVMVSKTCTAGSPVVDPKMSLDFPSHVLLTSVIWSVCFDSRGFPDANVVATLEDDFGEQQHVEIFLGGAVRIQ